MADTLSHIKRLIIESPPGEWALNRLRELLINALKQGPIPQHVAFVMDGNRRYARSHRMEIIEGHHHGFEALAKIMEVCYKCGVKVVTVYAFSIENFNRPKYEVEGLMQLAKVKLEQLTTYGDILDRYGACVRILGQRDLIREDVLEVMDKAVARTRHNNKAVLNICVPYTSRAEITTAIRSTVQDFVTPSPPKSTPFSPTHIRQKILSSQLEGRELLPTIPDERTEEEEEADEAQFDIHGIDGPDLADSSDKDIEMDSVDSTTTTLSPGSPEPLYFSKNRSNSSAALPNPDTITAETIEKHLYTADDPPLDLFVRTSGVERLSDFMLWQCHQDTHIFFRDCLWPDFSLKDFLWVLLEWQWRAKQSEREGSSGRARGGKGRRMTE